MCRGTVCLHVSNLINTQIPVTSPTYLGGWLHWSLSARSITLPNWGIVDSYWITGMANGLIVELEYTYHGCVPR